MRLEELERELRAERAEMESDFAAKLDEWAAAGFPRGERPSTAPLAAQHGLAAGRRGMIDRARRHLALTPPRRLLAPIALAASALVVGGVAISESGLIGKNGSGDELQALSAGDRAATSPLTQNDAAPAVAESAPQAGKAAGGIGRKVQRDAQMTLAANPGDVPDVAGRATDVVENLGGVVLSSRVEGSDERSSASLQLQVPSGRLDSALTSLADLAEVRSRSEGSLDVTRPYVSARDQLSKLTAERKGLLRRLAAAGTDQQAASVRARIDALDGQIATARADFRSVSRQARDATIDLEITSDGKSSGDGFGIDDALHDAGHVLTVAAGIALISGAVLVPLAILAAIALLIARASRTRSRQRALDDE